MTARHEVPERKFGVRFGPVLLQRHKRPHFMASFSPNSFSGSGDQDRANRRRIGLDVLLLLPCDQAFGVRCFPEHQAGSFPDGAIAYWIWDTTTLMFAAAAGLALTWGRS